ALEELTDALARLRRHFQTLTEDDKGRWYPTCALTILGTPNDTINRVPAEAGAHLDIRFPPPHTVDDMVNMVRGVLGPDIEAEPVLSANPVHLSPD
ncbi:MAG: peptidase dimerization domain-containing protein, partial [Akkermansiaceae bacterium]|nr:peptidase dimerization domain-containing protein [Akkermansiaceae bacterium]